MLGHRSIVDSCSFPQQYLCKWPNAQGTVSLGQFYHLRSVSASPVLPCPVHSNTIYDMVWTHPKFIPREQSRQIHKAINIHHVYVAHIMWRHQIQSWASRRRMATSTELGSPLALWLLWISGGLVTSSCLLWWVPSLVPQDLCQYDLSRVWPHWKCVLEML